MPACNSETMPLDIVVYQCTTDAKVRGRGDGGSPSGASWIRTHAQYQSGEVNRTVQANRAVRLHRSQHTMKVKVWNCSGQVTVGVRLVLRSGGRSNRPMSSRQVGQGTCANQSHRDSYQSGGPRPRKGNHGCQNRRNTTNRNSDDSRTVDELP